MEKNNWFKYPYSFGGYTDIGLKRSENQDRFVLCPELSFFAVIDGMGGLPSSMQAVQTVEAALPLRLREAAGATQPAGFGEGFAEGAVKRSVEGASDEVFLKFNASGWGIFGGATLACAWLFSEYAVFAGLGDCRGYILRGDGKTFRQITEDHNEAGELVRKGWLTKAEAMSHPATNRLTRFAGMEAPAKADCFTEEMRPGDSVLLCSDGLHGQVLEDAIIKIMGSGKPPGEVCQALVDAANGAGGTDNATAVCVRIGQGVGMA